MAGSVLLACGTTGCKDFLDQTSPSEMTADNVYNSVYYTGIAVNKLYGLMCQDQTWSQTIPIVWGLNTEYELVDGLGKDNAVTNRTSERAEMNYCTDPGWAGLAKTWDALYQMIENANMAIENIEASPLYEAEGATGKQMKAYRGEVLTLRALCYLTLVRFWGDVPLKLETSLPDLSNVYLPKTDRDEILERLQSDLQEAAEALPWAGRKVGESYYTQERVTKGYALALRANCAMTEAGYAIRESAKSGYETLPEYSDGTYPTQRPDQAKRTALYEQALADLATIIKEGPHSLNPSVKNYWDNVNQRELDHTYYENLFEVPMGLGNSSELGYTVGVRINGASAQYGAKGNSSGKCKVTAPLFWSYDRNDPRRDLTCGMVQLGEVEGVLKESVLKNPAFTIYVGKWDIRKMNEEWRDAAIKTGNAKWMSGINPCLCRYPHVLLWYAEVLNELAGPTGGHAGDAGLTAKDALAQVHLRAFNDVDKSTLATALVAAQKWVDENTTDKETCFEAIVQEGAWELSGEGVRKYDMIRWGNLMSRTEKMKQEYADLIQEAPAKIGYNFTDKTMTVVDMSSIDWYDAAQDPSAKQASVDFFGAEAKTLQSDQDKGESKSETNKNVPYINYGLFEDGVRNRYIMPIASTTISTSHGMLHNSYGFSD